METRTLMILAPLVLSLLASAKETVWTGVQNASWTEPNNWTAGVPEMFDTAVFDATGASGATTIDLAGQTMVTNIVVRGSGCPKYVFGASATQKLLLPFTASQTDGSGFIVESSVPAANVPVCCYVLSDG